MSVGPLWALMHPGEDPHDDALAWMDAALCAQTDPEIFFPEKGGSTKDAKETCMGCPSRAECLEYALVNGERYGIWGGMSERERRRLEKDRAAAAAKGDESTEQAA